MAATQRHRHAVVVMGRLPAEHHRRRCQARLEHRQPVRPALRPDRQRQQSSGEGDKTVSWTWNQPSGNGRPVTGYQYSVDGGGWQNVGKPAASSPMAWAAAKPRPLRSAPYRVARPAGSAAIPPAAEPNRRRRRRTSSGHASSRPDLPGKPGQTDSYTPGRPPVAASAGWSGPGARSDHVTAPRTSTATEHPGTG